MDRIIREIIKTKSGKEVYLTRTELKILKEVGKGLFSHEIAKNLILSVRTVENHRQRMMKKLECRNVVELTITAIKLGIVKV